MAIDDRIRLALPRIVNLTLIAAVVGGVYGYVTSTGDHGLQGVGRGALTGALIGGITSSLDEFVLRVPGAPLTRAPFLLNVGVRSLVYLVTFLLSIAAGHWLLPNSPRDRVFDFSPNDIVFCFAATFVISFLLEVNSLLGQNVLLSYVTGRYHRARVEQRVFLMIDMKNSTAAAERLGEVDFHRLLNRFVNDLTSSIVMREGQIHKYVGDELIATWPLAAGLKDARCLRACFGAIAQLGEAGLLYEREFGQRVEIRASLHCGPVVVGEMGTVKKEIALIGDTLNTTARLVDACRESGERVIASAALIDQLALPSGITARALGPIALRGKESTVDLFAMETEQGI
jgi:adenylate cyclase